MDDKGNIRQFPSHLEAQAAGFPYKISQWEKDYLNKYPVDERIEALVILRYEFAVLTNSGKRKCDTMKKIDARNAIKFAFAFLKLAQKV